MRISWRKKINRETCWSKRDA